MNKEYVDDVMEYFGVTREKAEAFCDMTRKETLQQIRMILKTKLWQAARKD